MVLSVSAIVFPEIDPVLVNIGPVAIRWYALAYISGIVLGYFFIKHLNARQSEPLLTPKQLEDMMMWAVIGIIIGGRLGYVLFYKPDYYLAHPQDIIAIWKGGMSFHGGLLGVIGAFYVFSRWQKVGYLKLMDLVACAAPVGLFFGRMANFINAELYGRVSDVPWAVIFPYTDGRPRHPSQLYEALLEGALLFTVLYGLIKFTHAAQKPGLLSGVFLIGYGASRAFVELFREPDAHLGFILGPLTMGQLLCVPMLLVGGYLVFAARNPDITSR